MSVSLFIAKRYLFSKKSTSAINIISGISVVGVAVATMALVIVLSVFNGFHDLVASLFTSFDPQIEIVPAKGKFVAADDLILTKIKAHKSIAVATECVEDEALAVYRDKQIMVSIKGVEDNFEQLTDINHILYGDGSFYLHAGVLDFGIPGIRISQNLGLGANWPGYLKVYAPKREGQLDMNDPTTGFNVDSLLSAGSVFSVKQGKYDGRYILTSIGFARRLFELQGMVSSLELKLKDGVSLNDTKRELKKISGDKFKVLDRFEQQEDTFRIMAIEKFIAYVFLSFILVVACFNIIGSLSMLIVDKREDVKTLRSLGANDKQITRIFLFEGRIISVIGAIIGIGLGLLLCWIQQEWELVKLGQSEGAFIINAYPVSVHYIDVFWIFVTVIVVGWMSVYYPVRNLSKKLLK